MSAPVFRELSTVSRQCRFQTRLRDLAARFGSGIADMAGLAAGSTRSPMSHSRLSTIEVPVHLRVRPETSRWIAEFSEHEAD
jgi:hypothetical protein